MYHLKTRRQLLRVAGVGTAAGLAGCSVLPIGGTGSTAGHSDPAVAKSWLYDPTRHTEQQTLRVEFRTPSRFVAIAGKLDPEVRGAVAGRNFVGLPDDETAWSVSVSDPFYDAPTVYAAGGSFDESTAEANFGRYGKGLERSTEAGTTAGYQVRRFDSDDFGAYRAGRVVNVSSVGAEWFRSLLERSDGGDPAVTDAVDGSDTLLSRTGFDDAASVSISRAGSSWIGSAIGYSVNGDETTVRLVTLRGDRSAEGLRDLLGSIDDLRTVDAGADGDVRWATGRAGTDRFAFDGRFVQKRALPFDGS